MGLSLNRLFASLLLSFWLLIGLGSTAQAASIYTYTGSNFNNLFAPYTTSMSVSGSITLSSVLGPNLVNFDALPSIIDISFTDGINFFDAFTDYQRFEFRVTTNALGTITEWAIDADAAFGNTVSCNVGSTIVTVGGLCQSSSVVDGGLDRISGGFGQILFTPGSWALVVPEPTAALLIGLGLAGLGWRGCRLA